MKNKELILHSKINIKGWDLTVPTSNLHDRICPMSRKSKYTGRGLFSLHNFLTRKYSSI